MQAEHRSSIGGDPPFSAPCFSNCCGSGAYLTCYQAPIGIKVVTEEAEVGRQRDLGLGAEQPPLSLIHPWPASADPRKTIGTLSCPIDCSQTSRLFVATLAGFITKADQAETPSGWSIFTERGYGTVCQSSKWFLTNPITGSPSHPNSR